MVEIQSNLMKKISTILLILSLASCASYKPILDQNAKYSSTNEEQRQSDIDLCKKEASDYLDKFKAERAAREAGRKAIIGGVVGTVFGAISGKNLKSTLVGTAIGAGVGAAVGALSVAGEDKVKPDTIKQHYIGNCLAKKGYSVIGWY